MEPGVRKILGRFTISQTHRERGRVEEGRQHDLSTIVGGAGFFLYSRFAIPDDVFLNRRLRVGKGKGCLLIRLVLSDPN